MIKASFYLTFIFYHFDNKMSMNRSFLKNFFVIPDVAFKGVERTIRRLLFL